MDWRSLDAVTLEWAYNPQRSVKDFGSFQVHRTSRSKQLRKDMPAHLDVAYGPGPLHQVDVFPSTPGGPVHLFFHGGYWRTQDKANFAFVAGTLVPRGVTTVVVNYELCPTATLSQVVDSARSALRWTFGEIQQFGGDPNRISVSGNSAGAHLCAMLLATRWSDYGVPDDVIKGATLLSGIYDPEPARWISVNEEIGLTAEEAAVNNALDLDPVIHCPVYVGVGGAEPWPWIDQSHAYSQHLRRAGLDPEFHVLPHHHHFSIMDDMLTPTGVVARAVLSRLG